MPFDPNVADPDWSVTERLIVTLEHPADAFLWWLEGRRNSAAPNRAAIGTLLDAAFREAWPERVQRLVVPPDRQIEARPDGEWVRMPPGQTGVAFFGPYMPLRAGRHRVTFDIAPDSDREA